MSVCNHDPVIETVGTALWMTDDSCRPAKSTLLNSRAIYSLTFYRSEQKIGPVEHLGNAYVKRKD